MKQTINLGTTRELLYTLHAMDQIDEAIGDEATDMGAWLKNGKRSEILKKVAEVLVILVNAKIESDNVKRKAGMLSGETEKFITEEIITKTMTPGALIAARIQILKAITEGLNFELPPEMERERDYDLEEIESKNG